MLRIHTKLYFRQVGKRRIPVSVQFDGSGLCWPDLGCGVRGKPGAEIARMSGGPLEKVQPSVTNGQVPAHSPLGVLRACELRLVGTKPACVARLELNHCSCCSAKLKSTAPAPPVLGYFSQFFWLVHVLESVVTASSARKFPAPARSVILFGPQHVLLLLLVLCLHRSKCSLSCSMPSGETVQFSCHLISLKMLLLWVYFV